MRRLRRTGVFIVYAIVCLIVLMMWLRKGIPENRLGRSYHEMITGQASRPFVRRMLVPMVIRHIDRALPRPMSEALRREVGKVSLVRRAFERTTLNEAFASEYVIGVVLLYACLLGVAYGLRYLFESLYSAPPLAADLAPVFALLWLPPTFREANFAYVYDFPVLLFFSVGTALMVRRHWAYYWLVLVLACLNKETAILMIMLFGLHFRGQVPRSTLIGHLATQLGVYLVIQTPIWYCFRGNPGTSLTFQLMNHNRWLPLGAQPYDIVVAVATVAVAFLVVQGWARKPVILRQTFWMLVPLLVACSLFGYLDELRDYYEVFPAATLIMYDTFLNSAIPGRVRLRCPERHTEAKLNELSIF